MTKSTTISVIIPVFNDAERAESCLDALLRQTVRPAEIIVVDNGSSDDIASVVASYPGVQLIREAKRGVVFARTFGFDQARGEIIARLDGDSIPGPTWVEEVGRSFNSPDVSAASGGLYFHDVLPFLQPLSRILYRFVHLPVRHQFLAGANMAIRRDVWHQLRSELCTNRHLHEDVDIALHLYNNGQFIAHNSKMMVGTSARRMDDAPQQYLYYIRRWSRTYRHHQLSAGRILIPSALLLAGYPILKTTRLLQAVVAHYRLRTSTLTERIN